MRLVPTILCLACGAILLGPLSSPAAEPFSSVMLPHASEKRALYSSAVGAWRGCHRSLARHECPRRRHRRGHSLIHLEPCAPLRALHVDVELGLAIAKLESTARVRVEKLAN